jgi:hypothetical protein
MPRSALQSFNRYDEIATIALFVSFCSLLISFAQWRRSFRPIVTVAVKTHNAGNTGIKYNLVVRSSGTLPARNIRLNVTEVSLARAFGYDATDANQERWLACFKRAIPVLQNNDWTSCSFGTTREHNTGFWRYEATLQRLPMRRIERHDGRLLPH